MVKIADDKLGQDISIVDIDPAAGICDQFIIITGRNVNHTQAIADELEEKLAKLGLEPLTIEGYKEAGWILMDYADTIIHIFTQDQRDYYNLEGLWS